MSTHDPYCPAIRPHTSELCMHPQTATCGVCIHDCLCDLLTIIRLDESLKSNLQRIQRLETQLKALNATRDHNI